MEKKPTLRNKLSKKTEINAELNEYYNKLNDIIDNLTGVSRRWHAMANYDKVCNIGATSFSLNLLAEKLDKTYKGEL